MAPQLDRALIPAEQVLELLNQLSGSYNVVTISTVQGALEPEVLQSALDLSLQRHGALRSVLVGELDTLRFTPRTNPYIDLRWETVDSSDAWQSVVQTELNTPIDSRHSLIRAIWLRQAGTDMGHLITTLHHAISDGLSTIQLHHSILRDCQALLAGQSPKVTSPWPLAAPASSLFPPSHQGLRGKLASLFWVLKLKRKLRNHQPQTLPFEAIVPIPERQCGLVNRSLNAAQVKALRSRCRQENASIQAALCAAMLLSLITPLQVANQEKTPVVCRSFVDLRRHLSPPVSQAHLCLLASSLSTFHHLTAATEFWPLAREIKQQLNQGLARKDMFSALPMARKVVEALLERPNEASVTAALTNVGELSLNSDYGDLCLKAISFVPAQATFGGVFAAAATTFQGVMRLNFMFSMPSLSHETIATLADEMLVQIEQAVSAPT